MLEKAALIILSIKDRLFNFALVSKQKSTIIWMHKQLCPARIFFLAHTIYLTIVASSANVSYRHKIYWRSLISTSREWTALPLALTLFSTYFQTVLHVSPLADLTLHWINTVHINFFRGQSYRIREGVCCLTMCEASYQKSAAFRFVAALKLGRKWGTVHWASKLTSNKCQKIIFHIT